jgi:hypothetical protein
MTDYTEIDQALTATGITMTAVFVPQSKSRHAIKIGKDGKRTGGYCGNGEPCINWTCTFFVDGRELWTGDYSQGSGHLPGVLGKVIGRTAYEAGYITAACETGRAIQLGKHKGPPLNSPELRDVFYSLLMDSEAYAMGFEEWADNFGYDRDSRKAEATYNECAAIGRALAAVLSPAEIDRLREVFQDY